MKTIRYNQKQIFRQLILVPVEILLCTTIAFGQKGKDISGEVIALGGSEGIAFANVALFDSSGTQMVGGAAATETGAFRLENVRPGNYRIRVSALGYETLYHELEMKNEGLNLGALALSDNTMNLTDVNVVANRIRAKSADGKSTFFVSRKMQETSNSATDILKLIPGVQIDFQQNVSLQGSRNILLLVDGKERDRSFLSQLRPEQVDKIEVLSTPPPGYDASVTGVINIVLVHENLTGIDGQVYLEIPTSDHEIFLQPNYSFSFGLGKFNLFTSYNGDLRRFHVTDSYERTLTQEHDLSAVQSERSLLQKTWSHRFHYGVDWFVNSKNQLNFYGFYHPYSQEMDGSIALKTRGAENQETIATTNDEDRNQNSFYSLWYQHVFNENSGHMLTIDAGRQILDSRNSNTLDYDNGEEHRNDTRPLNRLLNLKLDYKLPLNRRTKVYTGVQLRSRNFSDRSVETYRYNEHTLAAYATCSYTSTKVEVELGVRAEEWKASRENEMEKDCLFALPYFALKYNLPQSQSLKLSWRNPVSYPASFQLNPYTTTVDPYTLIAGNPELEPERQQRVNLEYARTFKNHFLSAELFWQQSPKAIRHLVQVGEAGVMTIQAQNLGEIRQMGMVLSGAFSFGKAGINPYLKLADVYSIPGEAAREQLIVSRHQPLAETGLSAYCTFTHGFSASATLQYNTSLNEIQGESFSGALYFLSVEKAFTDRLKAGIVSGVPFTRDFTYQGNNVSGDGFSQHEKGVVHLSALPLWLKVTYRFSSGEKRRKIDRPQAETLKENKKGF